MATVNFVVSSGRDADNVAGNTNRLVNCYLEKASEDKWFVKSVLGTEPHAQVTGVFVRCMQEIGGLLYVASGGRLWSVTRSGAVADLCEILDDENTSISSNNDKIAVTAGAEYFVYDPATGIVTGPSGGAFDAASSVDFLGHYSVITEEGGRRFMWSDLADPETLNGLYFTTADGRDDLIIRGASLGALFVVFKEKSHELWYNTGGAGAEAFARVTGGVRDVGLAGFNLLCKLPSAASGQAAFVGSDGRLYMFSGGSASAVSTPALETAIAQKEMRALLTYEDEGHTFVCLVFRDDVAWCYDLTTGFWHERAEGPRHSPWTARATAKMGDDWMIGQDGGKVSKFSRVNRDGPATLYRMAVSETLYMGGKRFIVRALELKPRQGFTGADVLLRLSRDGGLTWTLDKPMPMGGVGHYGRRLIWRNLGQARQLTAAIGWTAPVDVSFSTKAEVTT